MSARADIHKSIENRMLAIRDDGVPSRHAPSFYIAPVAALLDFDLRVMVDEQREWSTETFGPGARLKGVLDHIRSELAEVEADPTDVTEWIDVVILALDGAWRSGHSPEEVVAALRAKYAKNRARVWPDWRTATEDERIEHVREATS